MLKLLLIYDKKLQNVPNYYRILQNFDQHVSGFFENAPTFRSFHGAFRSLHAAFTPHSGIGTSSAGRCMRPDAPFLAHAAPLGLPAALRDLRKGDGAFRDRRGQEDVRRILWRLHERILLLLHRDGRVQGENLVFAPGGSVRGERANL